MSFALSRPATHPPATRPALAIAGFAILTIAIVWGVERAGYPPCELCLKERIPFYAAVPLAALVAWLVARGRSGLASTGFVALAIIFAAGAALGVYHSGVERKLWQGPTSCTGSPVDHPADVSDFLKQLQTTQVVRCDAPALRIAGLSLAEWNVLACLGLAGVALYAFRISDPHAR